jgi:hypothetical protein
LVARAGFGHFELRKVALDACTRGFGTPCVHEHSCIRCPLLRPDPGQQARLREIRDNLKARIAEAGHYGWLGEIAGLVGCPGDAPRRGRLLLGRLTGGPPVAGAGVASSGERE